MTFRVLTGARVRLLPDASDSLSGFWYHEIPDFEEMCFVLHLLRPGELFVDVGANQGGWALTLAGMGARVIAFEPVPLTFQRLRANVNRNALPIAQLVHAIPCALGEKKQQVKFTSNLDAGNRRIEGSEERNGSIVVDLERADSVLRRENPVAIKIDVEGEELGVLKGAREILSSPSLLALIVETFRPQNSRHPALIALEGLLNQYGFLPVAYDP
jgi:FkbM family methyltransferase